MQLRSYNTDDEQEKTEDRGPILTKARKKKAKLYIKRTSTNYRFWIGLFLVLLSMFISYRLRSADEAKLAQLNAKIASLQEQLSGVRDSAPSGDDTTPDDASSLDRRWYSAAKVGTKVASLQTMYSDEVKKLSTAKPNTKYKRISEKLSRYFGSTVYSAPWCPLVTKDYVWTFKTDRKQTEDEFPVLWVCRTNENKKRVVAFVTAEYFTKDRMFRNVRICTTGYGASISEATDSGSDYEDNGNVTDGSKKKKSKKNGGKKREGTD